MSMKATSAAIAGVALVVALTFYFRIETPSHAVKARTDRTPVPGAAAAPVVPPPSPDASATSSDTHTDNADRPSAPLPQSSEPAPIADTLEELNLPPVPEILDTERAFAAEAVDASWSPAAEARILGEIAQVTGLKLVTLRVECKTSLCRLHATQQELASGISPILDLVPRFGMKTRSVMSAYNRNGVPISLAYLERGSAAPDAPPALNIEIRRAKPE